METTKHPLASILAAGASIWALVITFFIALLCALAQTAAFVCELALLPITKRWACPNLLREVGAPRIVALWQEVADLS